MASLSKINKQMVSRILVVDDEPIVRDMLAEILCQDGYQVFVVGSTEEALSLLETQQFEIIISDLHLPGRSGMDLLVQVKANFPNVPVIVITGQPALDKAIDAMKKGAADFITKPFSIEQIQHTIHKNLQEQRLVRENLRLLAELNNKAVIEKLNRQLHQKVGQLEKLYRISESFQSNVDNRALLQHIVELAADLTTSHRVSLLSYDRVHKQLVLRASRGFPADLLKNTTVKIGEGIAGKVAATQRPYRVTSNQFHEKNSGTDRSYQSQSLLSVPIVIGGELFGVLNMTDKLDSGDFTKEDENMALILAEKAAIKIENNVLYEGIYESLLDTLKALVSTIEAKDPYTRQHSQRVTSYSMQLARKVGCNEEDLESIAFAGILHDIGKIGIEDQILLKTSKLTNEEYDKIKKHPVTGEEIVKPLGLLPIELAIIRHHHERIDGRGYPDGLKGEEIPLLARIVAVADSVDAMSSTRSYRNALSRDIVIEQLLKNSDTQFDANLVPLMVELIEEEHVINEPVPIDPIDEFLETSPSSRASISG